MVSSYWREEDLKSACEGILLEAGLDCVHLFDLTFGKLLDSLQISISLFDAIVSVRVGVTALEFY